MIPFLFFNTFFTNFYKTEKHFLENRVINQHLSRSTIRGNVVEVGVSRDYVDAGLER